jgi:hypothetical protein
MSPFKLHASVPPGLCAALYKGTRPGVAGVYNRLGRLLDHGPYSHMELVTTHGVSLSSSYMDGGVRGKLIGFSSVGHWDFIPIPDPSGDIEGRVWKYFNETNGRGYDVWGNVRFAIGAVSESRDLDFCSEWGMAALTYREAWRYGPNGAATALLHDFGAQLVEVWR